MRLLINIEFQNLNQKAMGLFDMRQVSLLKNAILILNIYFLVCCNQIQSEKHSVLIIAIEKLGANDFSCHNYEDPENTNSGFKRICEEGIRFTHTFTPSVLSAPAIGGMLTGIHPFINGLRDNGGTSLSGALKTIPELLIEQKVTTLFIGTSPTIKRHSRLHQGFEKFDDDFNLQVNKEFRSSKNAVQIFKDWYIDEVKFNNFFAVLQLSNLLFPYAETTNEMGELRPLGFEAQLEDLDYSLYQLFKFLDDRKAWEKNYIFLVGLNGKSNFEKLKDIPNASLSSDISNVVFFVKPPKGREETPHHWKIDESISLLDIGPTLADIFNVNESYEKFSHEFLNSKGKELEFKLLKGESLFNLINKNKNTISSDRLILIESAWSNWINLSGIRYLLRKNNWVYNIEEKPYYFNDLIDRNQTNKIYDEDHVDKDFLVHVKEVKQNLGLTEWRPFDDSTIEMFSIISQYDKFKKISSIDELKYLEALISLVLIKPDVNTVNLFLFNELIKLRKWNRIEQINKVVKSNLIAELIKYLNLSISQRQQYQFVNSCLSLLLTGAEPNVPIINQPCSSNLIKIFSNYVYSNLDSTQKELLAQKFSRIKNNLILKKAIYDLDIQNIGVFGVINFLQDDLLYYEIIKALPQFQRTLLTL